MYIKNLNFLTTKQLFADIAVILSECLDKISFKLKYPEYLYSNHPYAHFVLLKNDKIHYKGKDLYRIKALTDINEDVKKGDLGGYVENRYNLHCQSKKKAWIYDQARVGGGALVTADAQVRDQAIVWGPIEVQKPIISGNTKLVSPVRKIYTEKL